MFEFLFSAISSQTGQKDSAQDEGEDDQVCISKISIRPSVFL
jgi:hypothetical protein